MITCRTYRFSINRFVLLSLVIACVSIVNVSHAQQENGPSEWPTSIVLMAGPSGGNYYSTAATITAILEREIPELSVTILPGGTVANVAALQAGTAQLGLGASATIASALAGEEPFEAPADKVRQIATLWAQGWQLMVRADSGITSVNDLVGKSLAPGARTQAGEVITEMVLNAYDISYDDLETVEFVSGSDAAALVKDRIVDGFSNNVSIPYTFHLDIASSMPARLVPVADDKIEELQAMNPGLSRIVVPGGTYPGIENDVVTFGDYSILMASADLPASFVRAIVNALQENSDQLRQSSAILGQASPDFMQESPGQIPQHEGATEAYSSN